MRLGEKARRSIRYYYGSLPPLMSGSLPTTRVGPLSLRIFYDGLAGIGMQIAPGNRVRVSGGIVGVVNRVCEVLVRDHVRRSEDHEVVGRQGAEDGVNGGFVLRGIGGRRDGSASEGTNSGRIVEGDKAGWILRPLSAAISVRIAFSIAP